MSQEMILVFLSLLLGGFTSGAAGFGIMMIALPILTLGMTVTDAVLVCCIVAVPTAVQLAWLYRRFVNWPDTKMLWLGCIPGCIVGAYVLKIVPMAVLQLAISITIVCFILLQLLRKKSARRLPDSRFSLLFAGAASGFAHSAVSLAGVPIGIFILLKGWDKDRSRATMSSLFLFCCWVTFFSQWATGLYTAKLFKLSVCGVIGALLGQELGFRAGRYLDQKMFIRFVLFFLSMAAVTLFYKSMQ